MIADETSAQPNWFRQLIAPPRFKDDEDKTRVAQFLNVILFVGMVLIGMRLLRELLTTGVLYSGDEALVLLLPIMVGLLIVMRRGYVRAASVVLLGLAVLAMVFVAAGSEGIHDGAFFVLAALVVMASLLIDWKASAVVAAFSIAAGWWLAGKQAGIPQQLERESATNLAVDSSIVFILIVVLMYLIVSSLQQALKRSRAGEQDLRQQNIELATLRGTLDDRVAERTAQLRVSAEVSRAATSVLEPDRLLKLVTTLITERFGFYYAAIFTLSEDGRYAVLREAAGPGDAAWVLKQSGHKLEIGEKSMVSTAINSRQPRIALDVGTEAMRFANPLLPDTRSEIALPLIVGDQVLGALDVQSTQLAAFDEASANVLQALTAQIAVAISNAAQYQREQVRAKQTTGLLAATLELSSQPDQARLFERIEAVTISLLNADGAGLWFPLNEDRLELQHTVNVGSTNLIGRQLRVGEGLVGKVYSAGVIMRVDDYGTWSEQSSTFADAPFHSAMGVPLLWQNRSLGVLAITRSKPGQPFTLEDENMAQLLAAQVAAALENMQLRAEQQQALAGLDAVNRRLTGEVWQERALSQNLTYEHGSTAGAAGTPGLSLRIPIELRGTPIGTITLEDEQARILSNDEYALINGITQQLALALENQRLSDVAQSNARRDRAIAETADKIHQPTDLDTILRVAVNELSRITGISGVGVQFGFSPAVTSGSNGHPADRLQENE